MVNIKIHTCDKYLLIEKAILEDEHLTWEEKGFYCYLMSISDEDLFQSAMRDYPELTKQLIKTGLIEEQ